MNYLPLLNEEEIHYICSAIPLRDTISYFQRNPKKFAKIMPGFRAKSLNNKDRVDSLLFRCYNQHFISSYIEKQIDTWLVRIQELISKKMEAGDSKDLALIYTLPDSCFAENVELFFKLTDEAYSEEYIELLNSAIHAMKETSYQQNRIQEELDDKESLCRYLEDELAALQQKFGKAGLEINKRIAENKELKNSIDDLEKLLVTIECDMEEMGKLKNRINNQNTTITELKEELMLLQKKCKQQETQVLPTKDDIKQEYWKPKRPLDMDEFEEYLGYNLESIGMSMDSDYYFLLIKHLSKILFQGIPIVVNRGTGMNLMKCIANVLCGRSSMNTLVYKSNLSIDDVNHFLSTAGRVVCLDNFLGNCNETELLPLFDYYRNRVIFMTIAYDRTMNYVSGEFLRYCNYLNINRIAALSANANLSEDPSIIEEVEYEPKIIVQKNRYANLLREMLNEFGLLNSLAEKKCIEISDEQVLCRTLAYDILPFCVDVLHISPYYLSERLIKYAGEEGKCAYKKLLIRWFAQ